MPMSKKTIALEIAQILELFYPETPIPLDHKDPYTLLVAVLLSAQCTDERVNKVTPTLFNAADNPYQMSKLEVTEIEKIIKPCGLSPKKSRAIHQLSQIIIDQHQGNVPANLS